MEITMEDPKVDSCNYIFQSRSHDSARGGGSGDVNLAQPDLSITETRDPSPSKNGLSSVFTRGCLAPPTRMLAPSPIPRTKRDNLVLPLRADGDESVVLKEKYEVIGTKAPPMEGEPSKKKLSKKRWSYLSFRKGENGNQEKVSATKGLETVGNNEVSAGSDESWTKQSHQLLRPQSRSSLSLPRSRGRGISPVDTRGGPKDIPKSTTRRHVSHSPFRSKKPERMHDSNSVGPSINTKASVYEERNDQSSKANSRHMTSEEEQRMDANNGTLSSERDIVTIFPSPESPPFEEHDVAATKPVRIPSERSQLSCDAGVSALEGYKKGTNGRTTHSTATVADEVGESGPGMQIRATPAPSIHTPFCGSNNAVADPLVPSRSCLKKPASTNHFSHMDKSPLEEVQPLSANSMDDELLKPESIKIHSPDDFPPKMWNHGTIASLVRAANVQEVDGLNVVDSFAHSADESNTLTSSDQGQAAPSASRFSGSMENVARALGPFQSCILKDDYPRKTTQTVKFKDPVLVDSQSVKSVRQAEEPVYHAPSNTTTTAKPPIHPHRARVIEPPRVEVDDNASVVSLDTQGTHQSTASRNVSKSLKTAIKGLFSKRDSKNTEKETQPTEEISVVEDTISTKSQGSDHHLSNKKRSTRKIETYVMESIEFLEEAAGFIDKDPTEVEIFVAKAFACVNEAEKLATILTSSAPVWEEEGTIRSVPSASDATSTTSISFMHQLDRRERLRRLERLSFADFGKSGMQSMLCHGGGTIPFDQTRNLALETIQTLDSLSHVIHFSSRIEKSIRAATSSLSKKPWLTYGNKSLGTKLICGKNDMGEMNDDRVSHKRLGLLPQLQVPMEPDGSTRGFSSNVVNGDDNSSFMENWSPKKRNKRKNKTVDELSTTAADASLNYSFSNTISTYDPKGHGDHDTSYVSFNGGTSYRGSSIVGRADSVSGASTTSLSVMKDMLELLAQEYCDRMCGGPPMEDMADDEYDDVTAAARDKDGESVVDMEYYANVARRERRRRGYL